MNGSIKETVNSTQLVLNVNPQLGFRKKKMKNDDDKIDMYEGYWKYVGVVFVIILGLVLTWWGINILFNYWFYARTTFGPIGNMALVPLFVGPTLCVFGVAEFLRILKKR